MTDRIARRQRRGRLAGRLLFPTAIAGLWLMGWSEWFAIPILGALGVLQVFVFIASQQCCPLCRARLIVRRRFFSDFATTCPQCDCPID